MQEFTVVLKASPHITSYRFVTSDLEQTKPWKTTDLKTKASNIISVQMS